MPPMPTGSDAMVDLSFKDGVATLLLNRPDARNALSLEMIQSMAAALEEVEAMDGLRVLVLSGAGKCFCAGMDLKAVQDDPGRMGDMLRQLAAFITRLRRLPVPTIARVQGAAIGGGCGLMVVCDFSITHPEAKVGYPEVDLGISPAVVAPWLIKRIGSGRARAMLLAGGTIRGEEGFACGLATHLVPLEQLSDTVAELASKLISGAPKALSVTKQWLNELDGSLDEEVLQRGADISADLIQGEEAQTRLKRLFSR